MGCAVNKEMVLPHAAASRPEARMDMISHGGCTHPGGPHSGQRAVPGRAERGSARRASAAAAAAENDKRARYPR
eukprot:7560364-Pyramimonas_sp.AAC.1